MYGLDFRLSRFLRVSFNESGKVLQLKRLYQNRNTRACKRADGRIARCVAREEDKPPGGGFVRAAEVSQQLLTTKSRHPQIGEDHIVLVTR